MESIDPVCIAATVVMSRATTELSVAVEEVLPADMTRLRQVPVAVPVMREAVQDDTSHQRRAIGDHPLTNPWMIVRQWMIDAAPQRDAAHLVQLAEALLQNLDIQAAHIEVVALQALDTQEVPPQLLD